MTEKSFLFPMEVENDSDYLIELKSIFNRYQDFLRSELPNLYILNSQSDNANWDIDMILKKTDTTCKKIIDCIELYYRGRISQSQRIIKAVSYTHLSMHKVCVRAVSGR